MILITFTNARNKIRFHHSLIIAVCSEKRHSMAGRTFHCPIDAKKVSSASIDTSTGPQKTIDLHTATSLIGRLDGLDMSLGDLGLHEYATNGVLTLYSIVRTYQHGDNDASVGKEEIFRYRPGWVIPLRIRLTSRKSQVLRAKRDKVMHVFCQGCECSRLVSIRKLKKIVCSACFLCSLVFHRQSARFTHF
jgi:hypothetical protein